MIMLWKRRRRIVSDLVLWRRRVSKKSLSAIIHLDQWKVVLFIMNEMTCGVEHAVKLNLGRLLSVSLPLPPKGSGFPDRRLTNCNLAGVFIYVLCLLCAVRLYYL